MLSALEVAGEVVSTGSGVAEDLSGDALAVYSVDLAAGLTFIDAVKQKWSEVETPIIRGLQEPSECDGCRLPLQWEYEQILVR